MSSKNTVEINLDALEIDKVLAYYDGPMLFVNKDPENHYFLAYCCDIELDEYVLAKTSIQNLIDMLKNEKTIYSVFQESLKKWKIKSDETIEKINEFDKLDLLDDDVYIKNLGGSFEEYINSLQTIVEKLKVSQIVVNLKRNEYTKILAFNEPYNCVPKVDIIFNTTRHNFNVWRSKKIIEEIKECLV